MRDGPLVILFLAAILLAAGCTLPQEQAPVPAEFCNSLKTQNATATCLSYRGADDAVARGYFANGDTLLDDADKLNTLVAEENSIVAGYNSAGDEPEKRLYFTQYLDFADRFATHGALMQVHLSAFGSFILANKYELDQKGMDSSQLVYSVTTSAGQLKRGVQLVRGNIEIMEGEFTLSDAEKKEVDSVKSRLDTIDAGLEGKI